MAARILDRLSRIVSLLLSKPSDPSTEGGRARERHRRIALTAASSALARTVSILTALAVVPLTVGYLGEERYGLWMAMGSLVAMLGFADLGLGNGLLNSIAQAHGRDDRDEARRCVSSAFVLLGTAALVILAGFAVLYSRVDWGRLFGARTPLAAGESGPAAAVFVVCFAATLPLSIVNRVLLGYQEGFRANLWAAGGSLLSLAAVSAAVVFRAGLPWLVAAVAGAPALAMLANSVIVFGFDKGWLRPSWRSVSAAVAGRLFRVGGLFLILQVAAALAFASDGFVIARLLEAGQVTQYAVPARLFSIVGSILMIVLTPLWPAYGEAIARGDVGWARRTLVRSLLATVVGAGAASFALVVFGRPIIRLWAGPEVTPTFDLLLPLGIWAVMSATGNSIAMFLNGAGVVRFQVVCASVMAAAAVSLKFLLTPEIGIPGVAWATIASYLAFSLIPFALFLPGILKSATTRPAEPRAGPSALAHPQEWTS